MAAILVGVAMRIRTTVSARTRAVSDVKCRMVRRRRPDSFRPGAECLRKLVEIAHIAELVKGQPVMSDARQLEWAA